MCRSRCDKPWHRYRDAGVAAAAGMAVRWGRCGQFVGDPHTCPADRVVDLGGELGALRGPDWPVLGRMTDPQLAREQLALSRGDTVRVQLLLPMTGHRPSRPRLGPAVGADAGIGTVRVELVVGPEDNGSLRRHTSALACTCAQRRAWIARNTLGVSGGVWVVHIDARDRGCCAI